MTCSTFTLLPIGKCTYVLQTTASYKHVHNIFAKYPLFSPWIESNLAFLAKLLL